VERTTATSVRAEKRVNERPGRKGTGRLRLRLVGYAQSVMRARAVVRANRGQHYVAGGDTAQRRFRGVSGGGSLWLSQRSRLRDGLSRKGRPRCAKVPRFHGCAEEKW
jgi:hypothetical protein